MVLIIFLLIHTVRLRRLIFLIKLWKKFTTIDFFDKKNYKMSNFDKKNLRLLSNFYKKNLRNKNLITLKEKNEYYIRQLLQK